MHALEHTAEEKRSRLLKSIDTQVMRDTLKAFSEATKLMVNVVDVDGRSVFTQEEMGSCCLFCKLIYSMDGGLERCRRAYKRYGKQAALVGEPYIFRCPAGLIEWAAPLIVDGEHLGSVICGQVLMWEPDDYLWIELREFNKELTDDFTDLFAAAKELPVVSPGMVKSASFLMHVIASYITGACETDRDSIAEVADSTSILYKGRQSSQPQETKLGGSAQTYSLTEERELIKAIKLGDVATAKRYLQKLLLEIIVINENDFDRTRTSILELCVVISRSAVDIGVDIRSSGQVNTTIFNRIYGAKNIEYMCQQAQRLLEKNLMRVIQQQKKPANSKVEEIKKLIRSDFKERLTLETISQRVFLSPSYASRLFKKVQNCSIMEYLTRVRMEEAKRLLKNPMYLIDEVAAHVGYSDASYFTKVFRRVEGMTPTEYRNTQHA